MANEIRAGNRRILSQAITLVEASGKRQRSSADKLIDALSSFEPKESLRVGLTGAPGAGKSTLINALGTYLVEKSHKIAVLAVDPSSIRTGGSILGDKTRMEELSRLNAAYIRPSPAGNVLGGVAKRTREVIFLCEQAGFDVIFVETTGVGQSEVAVSLLTDIFVLLIAPASGDELQGVKRGIMELADLIVVSKADGDLQQIATRTCAEYRSAVRLLARREKDSDDFPMCITVSANDADQIHHLWNSAVKLQNWRKSNRVWRNTRVHQELKWAQSLLRDEIVNAAEARIDVVTARHNLEQAVVESGTVFSPVVRNRLREAIDTLRQLNLNSKADGR